MDSPRLDINPTAGTLQPKTVTILLLIAVLTISALHSLLVPSSVHAQETIEEQVAISDPGSEDIQAQWMSVADYSDLHFSDADWRLPHEYFINWPLRPDDQCGLGPDGQEYKALPWIPQFSGDMDDVEAAPTRQDFRDSVTSPTYDSDPQAGELDQGNYFDASGDCSNRYVDGGTTTETQAGTPSDGEDDSRGAWLRTHAFGGWTSPSSTVSGTAYRTDTDCPVVDTGQFDGTPFEDEPRMWGRCDVDAVDHSEQLFNNAGYPNFTPHTDDSGDPVRLTSSGVTVFNHFFYVDEEDHEIAEQNPGVDTNLQAIADDWMRIYLNGKFVDSTEATIGQAALDQEVLEYLEPGEINMLAVQVVDKLDWHTGDEHSAANAAGIHYQINISGEITEDPEPEDSDVVTDVISGDKIAPPGTTAPIQAYIENQAQMPMSNPEEPQEPQEPSESNKTECIIDPDSQACDDAMDEAWDQYDDEFEQWEEDHAQWQEDQQEYDDTRAEKTSGDTELEVAAFQGDTGIVSPNPQDCPTGNLDPQPADPADSGDYNYREECTFDFNIDGEAEDEDRVWFQSRAYEDNQLVDLSDNEPRLEVVRNFEMTTDTTADLDGGDQDELTGTFAIKADIENLRQRALDGMSTTSTLLANQPLTVTMRISENSGYTTGLSGATSNKLVSPTGSGNAVTWSYSGTGPQTFQPQPTFDSDTVRATTSIAEGEVLSPGQVCFETEVSPVHRRAASLPFGTQVVPIDTGDSFTSEDCVDVRPVEGPYLAVDDGDVQGGAVQVNHETTKEQCRIDDGDNDDVLGRVRSGSQQGSRGTYAVAATRNIANFGSAENTEADILQFGNTPPGQYRAVCRPDLTDREYYEDLGYNVVTTGNTNIDAIINQVNAGGAIENNSVVIVDNPGTATPSYDGEALDPGRQVTIVIAEPDTGTGSGDLTITDNISHAGGSRNVRDDIPALGLVVGGDVNIESNVEDVQAYISANGQVDTCSDVEDITQDGVAPECDNELEIRGALLAESILFRRTGRDDGSGYGDVGETGPAERITFAPELLLSSPPGIFGSTNNIFAERPIRERLPLF